MNDDFVSLFAYNRWADRRVLEACGKLSAEQYAAEPVPGWASVRSSLVHIASATQNWIRRIAGEVATTAQTEADLPTHEAVQRHLDRAYEILDGLWPTLTPQRLAAPQTFLIRGRSVVLPPWLVLRHVVNHATYHRGQIASKLKRLGVEQASTDMVVWVLEQMPQGTEAGQPPASTPAPK
jgi:uncharacterized damage-inducible protein DinB